MDRFIYDEHVAAVRPVRPVGGGGGGMGQRVVNGVVGDGDGEGEDTEMGGG